MYKYIKGVYYGRRLSKSVASICRATTNQLIINGYDIKLPDTVKILQESYAFCFTISFKKVWEAREIGTTVEISKYLLKHWLLKVFQPSCPGINMIDSVESVIDDLSDYWRQWFEKLCMEHNDLQGKPIIEWIPSAISKFIIEIEFYISDRFSKTPEKFSEFLMLLAENSVKEIGVKN